jgi:hypothetical protein
MVVKFLHWLLAKLYSLRIYLEEKEAKEEDLDLRDRVDDDPEDWQQ